jgi:Rps23 Pro-64 3,4-dihydroxylase Tpa1-like proline 4-hydroxylase
MAHEVGGVTSDLLTISSTEPFPHFRIEGMLDAGFGDAILRWLQSDAPWRLRIESFYEQYEFSLLLDPPPRDLRFIVSDKFVDRLRALLSTHLLANSELELVDITVHRLVPGQTIRIHNDYLNGEETHRFLIQLNSGWDLAKGGLLILFASASPEDIATIFQPTHRSAFGFEISERSFHAVSTIRDGERFTLVYSFGETG